MTGKHFQVSQTLHALLNFLPVARNASLEILPGLWPLGPSKINSAEFLSHFNILLTVNSLLQWNLHRHIVKSLSEYS
jgi:hypothetical protein